MSSGRLEWTRSEKGEPGPSGFGLTNNCQPKLRRTKSTAGWILQWRSSRRGEPLYRGGSSSTGSKLAKTGNATAEVSRGCTRLDTAQTIIIGIHLGENC